MGLEVDPGRNVIDWRPGVSTCLRAGAMTGTTRLCAIEQWLEPGAGAPIHTHFDVEETVTVLSGRAEFRLDGQRQVLEAGSTAIFPPFSRHGFTNAGDDVLHVWATFSAAAVPMEYEHEPGLVLEIGGTGPVRHDAHRSIREDRPQADTAAEPGTHAPPSSDDTGR